MLSKLRDYSSYFLWFVVITFVGFMAFSGVQECGSNPAQRGILAEINGHPITLQAFSMAVSRAQQNRQQAGEELTDEQIEQLREQTWQQLVGALLLEQEADRRQIKVTDQELAAYLTQYPPEDLRQSEAFQTDGAFDYNKYLAAMRNTSPQYTQFWRSVEAYWRPQLRQSKLQQQVISTVRVSPIDLEEHFSMDHDQARVEFLSVSSAAYNEEAGTPTDEQLLPLYEDEKSRYRRDERVVLEYATWMRVPSQADSNWARDQIIDIKNQIEAGADFSETAELYTMDPSGATSGGDLGWFGRGAMVEPFEDAAYALKVGEMSDPVKTQFGWHLILLDDERPSETQEGKRELRARHILIRPELSQLTVDSVHNAAQDFAYALRAGEVTFGGEDVELAGGAFIRAGAIARTDRLRLVGPAPNVKTWAFAADAGQISDPIDDGGKFVVARVSARRPAGIAEFDEVRSLVLSRWIAKRARELARPQAESLLVEARNGAPLQKLAEAENVTLTTTGLFTRNMSIAQAGQSPIFMGTVFSMSEATPWSEPVALSNGWAIIHLLEMQPADTAKFTAVHDSLSGEILRAKQQQAFQDWFVELYNQAEIKDYRAAMYGSSM
jgi:peptidyl-prolyl cis-trans isomerase D